PAQPADLVRGDPPGSPPCLGSRPVGHRLPLPESLGGHPARVDVIVHRLDDLWQAALRIGEPAVEVEAIQDPGISADVDIGPECDLRNILSDEQVLHPVHQVDADPASLVIPVQLHQTDLHIGVPVRLGVELEYQDALRLSVAIEELATDYRLVAEDADLV